MIGPIGSDTLVGIALGMGLGARHAFEPDHLAAVSVLAADGPSPKRGALVGALWGTGHTLALLACGLAAAVAAARIPPRLTDAFELAVAAMLIVIGGRAVVRARPERHVHVPAHLAPRVGAVRPLIVGAVHGLAGSGALVALATAGLPTPAARVTFLALFGFGSITAMSVVSGLAGWPLARLARRPIAGRLMLGVAGTMSVVLGILWALIPVQHVFR